MTTLTLHRTRTGYIVTTDNPSVPVWLRTAIVEAQTESEAVEIIEACNPGATVKTEGGRRE